MPVFLDPDEICSIALDDAKTKAGVKQVVFKVLAMPIRKQRVLDKWFDEADKKAKELPPDQVLDMRLDKLAELVVGWENAKQPFSRDALEDVLDNTAAKELLLRIYWNNHLTADEKKSSES